MKTREKKNKKGTRMLNKLLAMIILVVTVVAIVIMSFVGKEEVEEISAVGTIETTASASDYSTVLATYNYDYNGSYRTFTVPADGYYKLQVWGAQGWSKNDSGSYGVSSTGGVGGYSSGIVKLKAGTKLYIYVGEQGQSIGNAYNGGGKGEWEQSSGADINMITGGGGGATDIRVGGTTLYHRMIVAGGGSGAVYYSNSDSYADGSEVRAEGHAGGGLEGEGYASEYCGTQTRAGSGGSFGIGADTRLATFGHRYTAGGGGGGWFGGGRSSEGNTTTGSTYTSNNRKNVQIPGKSGGGSGYVLTSSSYKPNGYAVGSEYYMNHAISATYGIPSPTGGIINGKTGNGYARIERLSDSRDTQPVITLGTKTTFKAYRTYSYNVGVEDIGIEKVYKYVVPVTGQYRLKVWGSQGSRSHWSKSGGGWRRLFRRECNIKKRNSSICNSGRYWN